MCDSKANFLQLPWSATIGIIERVARQKHLPDAGPTKWPFSRDPNMLFLRLSCPSRPRDVFIVYSKPVKPDATIIVFFHGIGQQLAGSTMSTLESFVHCGYGVVAVEYTGYGFASQYGPSSESAIYEDVTFALDYLLKQAPSNKIVLVGYSLGTGVAVEMAYRGYGDKLVLVAPYTSVAEMGHHFLPGLPTFFVDKIIQDKFDSKCKAPHINIPTLVIHGTQDQVIPYAMGCEIARKFPHVTMLTQPGMNHFLFQPPAQETTLSAICKFSASF